MKKIIIIFFIFFKIFAPQLEAQASENLRQIQIYLESEKWQDAWQASGNLQGKLDKKAICQSDPVVRLLHGHTSLAAGYYDEAMNQFYCACDSLNAESLLKWSAFCNEMVTAYPNFSSAHYLLGDALARLEKYDSAKAEFDKAIILSPNNFLALNARGVNEWIRSKLNNETMCLQCTEDWNLAISTKPDMADVYVNKGVSFLLSGGDQKRCIALFQNAINVNSNFSLAYNGVKVAYHSLGNSEGFFDFAPLTINTPFSKLDSLVHSFDSIGEARGYGVMAMSIPHPVTATVGATMFAAGVGIDIGNSIDKVISSTPQTVHQNQADLASKLKGGVYSIQIEGINKEMIKEGFPSISGTWFLLNYPSKTWKIK